MKRGDIYMVDFNPARGSEQAGYRPALIIQNDVGEISQSSPRGAFFMKSFIAGQPKANR
jgi:hypothetical protein